MLGRGAAAAAHDGGAALDDLHHLLGEVIRRSLEYSLVAHHGGIAHIGHGGDNDAADVGASDLFQDVVGAGDAVVAHGVHPRQLGRLAEQLRAPAALPGDAVGADGEGDDEEGFRALLFQILRKLRNSVAGGQGLHQEVCDPLGQELFRLAAVGLRRGDALALGHRAHVREHPGAEGLGRLLGDAAAGADDLHAQGLTALRLLHAHGEGVGLDSPAPGLQIGPVDGQDLLGPVQVGPLALVGGQAGQCVEIGAHGTVEQQGLPLLQCASDVHYPNTSLAISTDCRASLE